MGTSQEFYSITRKSDYFQLGRRSGTHGCLVSPLSFRPRYYRACVGKYQGQRRSTLCNRDDIQVCEYLFDYSICSTTTEDGQWLYSKVQQSFSRIVITYFVHGEYCGGQWWQQWWWYQQRRQRRVRIDHFLNKIFVLMSILGCFVTKIKTNL